MSDNLQAQEVRRRLIMFLCIPAEVWTDVLKLLPRRTLVQKIFPACYRLKEICNENVKSVHVITQSDRFTNEQKWDDPEIQRQFKQLSGNNCKLANQFRLTNLRICEKNKVILPHCLDLLKGCQISTEFNEKSQNTGTTFSDCLTILEPTKPIAIKILQINDTVTANNCLSNPTVRNCNRIEISTLGPFQHQKLDMMAMAIGICDWLHHKPMPDELDSDDDKPIVEDNSDDGGSAADQARCMIFCYIRSSQAMDWLLNRCIQNLRDSKDPADRRQFVLSFVYRTWPVPVRGQQPIGLESRFVENHTTGEVLLLERMEETSVSYRLRRCLAQEVANGREFYAKMFKREIYGKEVFNIDEEEAKKGTEVFVE